MKKQKPRKHRPKFTQALQEAFLENLRKGFGEGRSARKCGIERTTIWRKKERSEKFRKDVEQARMDADDAVEEALYKGALSGSFNAQKYWLQNRRGSDWKEQKEVILAGNQDHPVAMSWVDIMMAAGEDDDESEPEESCPDPGAAENTDAPST